MLSSHHQVEVSHDADLIDRVIQTKPGAVLYLIDSFHHCEAFLMELIPSSLLARLLPTTRSPRHVSGRTRMAMTLSYPLHLRINKRTQACGAS